MRNVSFSMVSRIGTQIGAFLLALTSSAGAASGSDAAVQPLEGWLVGVLVVVLISILSRHRPARFGQAKFGQDRTKPVTRSEH